MIQNYELIVKGIRNFENKVTVTLALRDKKRFDGEIFDLTSRWTVLKVPRWGGQSVTVGCDWCTGESGSGLPDISD